MQRAHVSYPNIFGVGNIDKVEVMIFIRKIFFAFVAKPWIIERGPIHIAICLGAHRRVILGYSTKIFNTDLLNAAICVFDHFASSPAGFNSSKNRTVYRNGVSPDVNDYSIVINIKWLPPVSSYTHGILSYRFDPLLISHPPDQYMIPFFKIPG